MISFETLCKLLAIFAWDAINDPTFASESSFKHDAYVFLHIFDILLGSDFVNQVRSIEATLEVDDSILDVELLCYVILYFDSCSRCQT